MSAEVRQSRIFTGKSSYRAAICPCPMADKILIIMDDIVRKLERNADDARK